MPAFRSPRELLADRRARWALAGIVVVALGLRLLAVAASPDFRPLSDAADYDKHALSLKAGNGYPDSDIAPAGGASAFRPPLYPIFLSAVYGVTGKRWTAARVVQAGLGTLAVLLIAVLALQLFGPTVALLSAGLAAVWPGLIAVNESLLSESLFLPLELGAVIAVVERLRTGGRRWILIAGVLAGLAWLDRGNALVLAIPLAFAVWTRRPRLRPRSLVAPVALLGIAALTIAPWTIRNAEVFDSFIPVSTQPGYALAGTYSKGARHTSEGRALWQRPEMLPEYRHLFASRLNEAEISSRLGHRATSYLRDHPFYPLTVAWWNTPRFLGVAGLRYERIVAQGLGGSAFLAEAGFFAIIALAPLVLLGAFTTAARAAPRWLWGIPLLLAASSIFILGFSRYRVPADPFLLMLASLGILALRDRLRGTATA